MISINYKNLNRGKRKKLEEKTFETTTRISKKPNILQDELNEDQKGKTIASIGEDRYIYTFYASFVFYTKRKHFEESVFRTPETVSKKLHMFQDEHNEKQETRTGEEKRKEKK
ncbi:hypothetical protein LIER_28178 [Lithospermum erythrorhizon]|uniref:Uncharacterized protein n=1 Tax=Lithospermum erythrorhizon TaxID=34254 RepID=A0AAV3RIK2_LITER